MKDTEWNDNETKYDLFVYTALKKFLRSCMFEEHS